MNINEKYQKLEDQAKADYIAAMQQINEQKVLEQNNCEHVYRIVDELFYACGQTAPGKYCDNCGKMLHLTTQERNEWRRR